MRSIILGCIAAAYVSSAIASQTFTNELAQIRANVSEMRSNTVALAACVSDLLNERNKLLEWIGRTKLDRGLPDSVQQEILEFYKRK